MKVRSTVPWVYFSLIFLAPLPLMFNSCEVNSQGMLSIQNLQYQCGQLGTSMELVTYFPATRTIERSCDFLGETNILRCIDVVCKSPNGESCGKFSVTESLFHYSSFADYIAEKKVGTITVQKYEETGRPEATISFNYDAQGRLIQQNGKDSSVVYDSWDSSGRPTHGFQAALTTINGSSQLCDCNHLELSRKLNDSDHMMIETLDATNAYCATANKEPCGWRPSGKGFSYTLAKQTVLYSPGIGKMSSSLSFVGVNASQQEEELLISGVNWGNPEQVCH